MESQKILVKDVQVDPNQPRKTYSNMEGLVESIKTNGFDPYRAILIQSNLNPDDPDGRKFQTIWGNRRTMASEKAGVEYLWAYVADGMSEQEIFEAQLSENEHREDLLPMERVFAIKDGLEKGLSVGRIAKVLCVSVQTVKADLELCDLAPDLHKFVDNGQLAKEVARKLASATTNGEKWDAARQMSVFNNFVKGAGSTGKKLAAIQAYIDKANQQDLFTLAKQDAAENGGLSKARKASIAFQKAVTAYVNSGFSCHPNVINARKRDVREIRLTMQELKKISDTTLAQLDAFDAKVEMNQPKQEAA